MESKLKVNKRRGMEVLLPLKEDLKEGSLEEVYRRNVVYSADYTVDISAFQSVMIGLWRWPWI